MSNLDINTTRGRIAASDQAHAAEIVFKGCPEFHFIATADTDSAAVDGFIVKNWIANGVVEIKSRDTDYETLMGAFKGEWLLTYQKLLDLQKISELLKIPAYGMLYLTKSNMVLVIVLTDSQGRISCRHREENTKTQQTCNGGIIERKNSFIDVRGAKIYRGTL